MTENSVENDILRLHAIVHGRVQGVSFRAFTLDKARLRNLTGWVRNQSEGTVEVVAEGEKITLEEFLEELYVGPPGARVTHVDVTWETATGEFTDFQIRYFFFS